MPRFSSVRSGSGNASILPTAYTITSCSLTTNSGKEYDISGLIAEIDIEEGLDQESIDVQLGIRDSIQFLENARIAGNEKIHLKIQHTTLEKNSKTKKKYDLELRVVEITTFVRPKPGTQIYRLVCFNEHMYINAIKKVVRPFKGSIGKMVKDLITSDLKIKKTGTINTETKGIVKGVYPRLSPLDAINWLCRNAYDNQTPFYFYDSLAEGVSFNSFEALCNEEVYKNYTQKPFMSSKPGSDEHYKEISEQINKISSNMNTSQLINLTSGSYASTLHTVDISNKSYEQFFYDYDKVNPKKLNNNRPYSTEADVDGIKYNQTIDSIHHFISKNDNAYELDNYHSSTVPTLLQAEAIKRNLTTMGQTITVAGDYSMSPGKKISITIPKSLGIDATGLKDKFITGNYIVTGIRHSFKEFYTMDLQVQKDSSMMDLDGEVL